jgi:hypothetical protein
MDIVLWVVAGLFLGLVWSSWSMSRSFFAKGRTRGIQDCIREMRRGTAIILECDEANLPQDIRNLASALETLLARAPVNAKSGTDTINVQLSTLGKMLGEACWLKGHSAGIRRKAPAEGKVRVDLSAVDLLQLGALANLGFQHMMPNVRLFDMQRFTGSDDANEAAQAVSRLEAAIPKEHRPDLLRRAGDRMRLINDWWTPVSERAIA